MLNVITMTEMLFYFQYNLRKRQEDDLDFPNIDLNDKLLVHHDGWTRSILFGKLMLLNCT